MLHARMVTMNTSDWLRHLALTRIPPALLAMFFLSAIPAEAADGFSWVTNGGAIAIVDYTAYDADVIVPAAIESLPVTRVEDSVFSGRSDLHSIAFPATVTNIGEYTFYMCAGLTAINVDEGNSCYSSADGVLFNKDQTVLLHCPARRTGDFAVSDTVTRVGNYAFQFCEQITNITTASSVASIGDAVFLYCRSLTNVAIGAGVTSIGTRVFYPCDKLRTITVDGDNPCFSSTDGVLFNKDGTTLLQCPAAMTGCYSIPPGVTRIGDYAFDDCGRLTNAAMPDTVVRVGDYAFHDCGHLTNLALSANLASIGEHAFWGCGLTDVRLPNSLTNIGVCAFLYCDGLTHVEIPGSVTDIGEGAFQGCGGLTTVVISNGITRIGDRMFRRCGNLTSIVIPGSVTSIGNAAFQECGRLASFTIPPSVTGIGDDAFGQCGGLGSCSIPASVTSFGTGVLYRCTNLVDITVDDANTVFSSLDGVMFNEDKTKLIQFPMRKATSYTIPASVADIGDAAFCCCESLTNVVIPATARNIGSSAFGSCSTLTGIVIPNGVTNIGRYAFSGCACLTNITIPGSVAAIGTHAFTMCNNMTALTISNGVSSIGDCAFSACTLLRSVAIPGSVTNIGISAFDYCTSLCDVSLSEGVAEIGDCAFEYCGRLTNAVIPDSVTRIGDRSFFSCGGLTNVDIGDNVTSIGGLAFVTCLRLGSVFLPSSVTNIGDRAFACCPSLTGISVNSANEHFTSLDGVLFDEDGGTLIQYPGGRAGGYTVPADVTNILNDAFGWCRGLGDVYFTSNAPAAMTNAFAGSTNGVVYYLPDTTGWGVSFGGRPTAPWLAAMLDDDRFGVQADVFGFDIAWASGRVVVVEACTDLESAGWQPVRTNTIGADSLYFSDPRWTNYPGCFYRLTSP